MKIKKIGYLFVMFCLIVLTIVTAPAKASASCSGDQCGCYDGQPECIAECPPVGDPAHMACVHDCIRGSVQCSICCCCEDTCPLYCS